MHVEIGYYMAKELGLPDIVVRPIAESHGKQKHNPYGLNPVLSPSELNVRTCIAVADPADAMLSRNNTFNQHLSLDERREWVRGQVAFVCEDYANNGSGLADCINQNIEAELMQLVG